jgi:type II secretory pathway component PulC
VTRSLWLFNLLLALLAIVLLAALVDSILDHEPTPADGRPLSLRPRKAAPAPEAEPPLLRQSSVPDVSEFEMIAQKDVFKNPFAEPVVPRAPVALPPPPLPPLPILVGTIIVGDEHQAILASNNRSDLFSLGQPVAGGTIVKIEVDRVLIERGGTIATIQLKAGIQQLSTAEDSSRVGLGSPQSKVPEVRPTEAAPARRAIPLRSGYRGMPRTQGGQP